MPRFSSGDFPDVARWDWDENNFHQYIGINCRPFGWCNISGDAQLRPSPDYQDLTLTPRQERRFAVKGWYDYQRLADAKGAGVALSHRWGALFPAPDLDQLNDTLTDFAEWRFVAQATLDQPDPGYLGKYNFVGNGLGPPDQVLASRIYLCRGGRSDCRVPSDQADCAPTNTWWAKIASPTDTLYRCVTRRGHEDKRALLRTIPGTVRWRWRVDDETAWVRCAFGCCTLE
jgi:hypothetical protein